MATEKITTILEFEEIPNGEGRLAEIFAFLLDNNVTVEDKDEDTSLQVKRPS